MSPPKQLLTDLGQRPRARSPREGVRDMKRLLRWLQAHEKRMGSTGCQPVPSGNLPEVIRQLRRDLADTQRRLAEYQHQLDSQN